MLKSLRHGNASATTTVSRYPAEVPIPTDSIGQSLSRFLFHNRPDMETPLIHPKGMDV